MLGLLLAPIALDGQLASANASRAMVRFAPRVHLECEALVPCGQSNLQESTPWVHWTDDSEAADVYVLVRGVNAGEDPSRQRFILDFTGYGLYENLSDVLTFEAAPQDAEEQIGAGIAQSIRMGLMRYAIEAGLGSELMLGFSPRFTPIVDQDGDLDAGTVSTSAVYDPWDYWTFRVGLSGNVDIQESRSSYRINPSVNADRVTEAWKINLSAGHNVNRETIEFTDRTVRNDRENWNLDALVVRSIGAHMSTGFDFGARNSIQNNQRARVTMAPGLEWNYYPYAESTRRQLIAHYAAGAQYNEYYEETIFGVTSQTIPMHKIGIQYRQSEGWGNAGVSVDGSQYLHESGLFSLGVGGNLSFRVIRGLDLNLNASGEWIRDQIHIPAGDLSEEDILLGRSALPTGYEYQFSIGLAYRWGSAFSNIVNSRFPSVSGGGGPGGGFGGFGGGGGRN